MENKVIIVKPQRIDSLTGLKFIAILIIFWWHSSIPSPSFDIGARACEFFFVSSGFLVMYNYYYKEIPFSWTSSISYYLTKVGKMWPLHFLGFIAAAILKRNYSLEMLYKGVLNLFCIQSWSAKVDVSMSYNGVSWYLSCLLFCYFMTPFLVNVLRKAKHKGIFFLITFIIRFFIEFVVNTTSDTVLNVFLHTNPFVRLLEFTMGMFMAIALIQEKNSCKGKIFGTVIESLSLILIVVVACFFGNDLYRAIYVLLFCLLVYIIGGERGYLSRILSNKLFLTAAKFQFEFYMIHQIVIGLVEGLMYKFFGRDTLWVYLAIVSFVITFVLSVIYNKVFAYPFERLMKYIINKTIKFMFGKSLFNKI